MRKMLEYLKEYTYIKSRGMATTGMYRIMGYATNHVMYIEAVRDRYRMEGIVKSGAVNFKYYNDIEMRRVVKDSFADLCKMFAEI